MNRSLQHMPRRSEKFKRRSAIGKQVGGNENAKIASTNAAKIRKQKEAALGEKGASMTQRFGRRAPPGTSTIDRRMPGWIDV